MFEELPPFLTVEQAAKVLQIGRSKADRRVGAHRRDVGPPVRVVRPPEAHPAGRAGPLRRAAPRAAARRLTVSNATSPLPVLIGPAAAPLRRALTSCAWVALECLVARADPTGDTPIIEIGIRELAADLGGSKNTAQRAIDALAAAGLVTAEHTRREDGTFLPTRYHLHLPSDVLVPVPPQRTRRTGPTATTHRSAEPLQLALPGT
jgi:DNA-binding transcriptional ArsR family regulator